jgi:hypothetical protein
VHKVLLLGINPSSGKPKKLSALSRMEVWMKSLGFQYYCFSNVIPTPGEYKLDKVDYDYVSSIVEGHDKVIALGGFVSTVLNRLKVEHFVLPHPSPLNRKLNDKNYEKLCLDQCAQFLSHK